MTVVYEGSCDEMELCDCSASKSDSKLTGLSVFEGSSIGNWRSSGKGLLRRKNNQFPTYF